jgi:hypothetical protein
MKILLVEDDEWIAEPLIEALVDQHYVVDQALDGEVAWTLLQNYPYDRPVHHPTPSWSHYGQKSAWGRQLLSS